MLRIYLDESGTHHGSQSIAVAAVWADSAVWSAWSAEWAEAIAPIKIYHAVDCHNRANEFAGFTPDDRDSLVKRALPVIARHEIYGFAYALQKKAIIDAAYRKLGGARKRLEPVGEKIFYPAILRFALEGFATYAGQLGPFAIVHEQNGLEEYATPVLAGFCREYPEQAPSYAFAPKEAYTPLQCADIVAYEANRQIKDLSVTRKPIEALNPFGDRFHWGRIPEDAAEEAGSFIASRLRYHSGERDS